MAEAYGKELNVIFEIYNEPFMKQSSISWANWALNDKAEACSALQLAAAPSVRGATIGSRNRGAS